MLTELDMTVREMAPPTQLAVQPVLTLLLIKED